VVAGAAWIALAWAPGGRATPDSAAYLDGARHLAGGAGFATSLVPIGVEAPRAITLFPPGFPALLVPGLWLGLPLRASAAWVLGLAFLGYAAGAYALILLAAGRRAWPAALAATGLLLLHPGTLRALDSVLSDLPFAAWAVWTAWLGLLLVQPAAPRGAAQLAFGFALAAGAALRWSGVFLGAPALAALLAATPRAARLGAAVRMGLPPLLLIGAWWLRNAWAGGEPTGARPIALRDPLAVLGEAWVGLSGGIAAGAPPGRLATGLVAAAALAVLASLATLRAEHPREARPLGFLGVTAAGYAACLALAGVVLRFDSLARARFWLPVLPLVAALAIGVVARSRERNALRAATAALLLGLGLAGGWRFGQGFARALPQAGADALYFEEALRRSAPVRSLLAAGRGCAVLSNVPEALLVQQAFAHIHPLPGSAEQAAPLFAGGTPVCLVYFSGRVPGRTVQRPGDAQLLAELVAGGRLQRVARDGFGTLWRTP